jgi:site-specific recombinase XerD
MPKISNVNYRAFLDKGEIQLIDIKLLNLALKNVSGIYGKNREEGRALLIALYLTGGRPIEVIGMQAKHVYKQDTYVAVQMLTAKRGKARIMYFRESMPIAKELYDYAIHKFPEMYLFFHYRSLETKTVKKKDGSTYEYADVAAKLTYHVKHWFKGVIPSSIPPYYLRHNRFTSMAQNGVSINDIQQFKGAKTHESVQAYLHLSQHEAKKIAKHIT